MYPYGRGDPSILFIAIAVVGGIIALRSWRALREATYDRSSRNMNTYSLGCGIMIFLVGISLTILWIRFLEHAMNS